MAALTHSIDVLAAAPGASSRVARPGCHEHLRVVLERAVKAAPAAWRVVPAIGEECSSKHEAEHRLRIWSLVEGFLLVRAGGDNKRHPAASFDCVHHNTTTRNFRGLEDRVEYNDEGERLTVRQRENTTVRQTDSARTGHDNHIWVGSLWPHILII